jgi:hypothetical protein
MEVCMSIIIVPFIAGAVGFFTGIFAGIEPMYAVLIGAAPVALFFIACVVIGVVKEQKHIRKENRK